DRGQGSAGDPVLGGGDREHRQGTPWMTAERSRARLSVNVNKVATLRNSRGGSVPSVVEATRVAVGAGAPGITVHPRADARHITFTDVREIDRELRSGGGRRRLGADIEGDTRPDALAQ